MKNNMKNIEKYSNTKGALYAYNSVSGNIHGKKEKRLNALTNILT